MSRATPYTARTNHHPDKRTKNFHPPPEPPVQQLEQAGHRVARAWLARVPPQDAEHRQAFQPGLVELRGVARKRIQRAGFELRAQRGRGEAQLPHFRRLREHHAPAAAGELAPQLAVDVVAQPPEAQPRRHERGDEVGDVEEMQQIGRHTSELQSLMRNSYAFFFLKKKTDTIPDTIVRVSSADHTSYSET